jgi:hypothetical protein
MIKHTFKQPVEDAKNKLLLAVFLVYLFTSLNAFSQGYLGIGIHLSPPARIDHCCNELIKIKPTPFVAFSVAYRRQWETLKHKEWYWEIGHATMGLNFYEEDYFNDTIRVSEIWNMSHIGLPSFGFGAGRIFPLKSKKARQEFSLGLDGSFRISNTLGGLENHNFGVRYKPGEDSFPLFLRLAASYALHFKYLKKIPAQLQLYTKLSFQNIAKGNQYLRDPATGNISEGQYRLNNSELGLKIFTELDRKHYKINWDKKEKAPRPKRQKGKLNYRLSLDAQFYQPPRTNYYIPQVDSFSLTGSFYPTGQLGIKAEFINRKNDRWSSVVGFGIGGTGYNLSFKPSADYVSDGEYFEWTSGGPFSLHALPYLGVAYRHPWKKSYFQHTLAATAAIPFTQENEQQAIVERSYLSIPPHLAPQNLLELEISDKYSRNKVLYGAEYQLERIFHMDGRLFFGFGLVLNYSRGIIGQGRVKVDNGRTQYYGGMTQHFGKIGLTLRVGWNAARRE